MKGKIDLIDIIVHFVKTEKENGISKDIQEIGLNAICKAAIDEVYSK